MGIAETLLVDMKAYLPLAALDGSTSIDVQGNHAGTATSCAINTIDQKFGPGCTDFDGVDSFISLANPDTDFNVAKDFSFGVWGRFTNWGDSTPEEYLVDRTNGDTLGYALASSLNEPRLRFFGKPTGPWTWIPSNILSADTWYWFYCENDDGTMRYYVDNSLIGTTACVHLTGSSVMYLGKSAVAVNRRHEGQMQQFCFLPRIATSAERAYIYNGGAGREIGSVDRRHPVFRHNLMRI